MVALRSADNAGRGAMAVFAFVILMATIGFFAHVETAWANAYSISELKGEVSERFIAGQLNSKGYADWNGGKISKAKSSNTKVATVKIQSVPGAKYNTLIVKFKKPGKTTITYKIHGKKYKAVVTAYKYKYKNPLKSVKVGGKEIASAFDKGAFSEKALKVAGTVQVKPLSGWKLKSIEVQGKDYSTKKVKNGYKLKKSDHGLTVILMNKKTKLEERIEFWR